MAIQMSCPGCGKQFTAPDSAAGRKGTCDACGSAIEVPFPPRADPLDELAASVSASAASPPATAASPPASASIPPVARVAPVARLAPKAAAGAASGSMAAGLGVLLRNPAQGIAEAHQKLGKTMSLQAGIVCAVLFDGAVVLGTVFFLDRLGGLLRPSMGLGTAMAGPAVGHGPGPGLSLPAEVYLKMLVGAAAPPVAIFLCMLCARALAKGRGAWQGDALAAGFSLFPFAVVFLVAPLLGPANGEVIAVLAVAALCMAILILFHGFKDLAGLSPGLATLAVPITLLLSAYMVKIIMAAIM